VNDTVPPAAKLRAGSASVGPAVSDGADVALLHQVMVKPPVALQLSGTLTAADSVAAEARGSVPPLKLGVMTAPNTHGTQLRP